MACGFESRPGHQTYIQGFRQVGKASDFDSDMRWFESINPYQNLGLKVFMDAYMPVTHEEGDRYPLGPPRIMENWLSGRRQRFAKPPIGR